MAVDITPLGFQKPDGYELVRNGDNAIAANAQKAQDLIATHAARLANLDNAAGFTGDPLALNDAAFAETLTNGTATNTALDSRLDTKVPPLVAASITNDPAADSAISGKINTPGSATATALNSAFVPKWKPTTAYSAGAAVLNPSGDTVTAIANFTSGTAYDATKWNLSTSYPTVALTSAVTANLPRHMSYLAREDKLAGWWAALAKCATTPANVLIFGDSISEGTGSTNVANAWVQLLQGMLRYNVAQTGGAAFPFIPTMPVTTAPGFPVTTAGTVTRGNSWGLGWKTGSVTATGTITYSFTGTSFKIMYFKGSTAGTMSIVVDGGPPVTVDTNSTSNPPGANVATYSSGALTRSAHTVAITSTSASSVYPGGILTWDGDETAGVRLHNAAYHGMSSGFFSANRNDNAADNLIAVGGVALVLINVGTNDLGGAVAPATYKTNVQSFITTLRGRGGYKGTVVLMNSYNGGGRLDSDWTPYGQQLDAIAATDPNVAYFDWRLRMPDDQNPVTLPSALGLFKDTLHPNDAGNAWIASMLADYLSLRSVPTVTTTKTASYTILPTDPTTFWVFNGASITGTIPDPTLVPTGARVTVKNINSTSLTVNSSGTSKTLDGAASQALTQWAKMTFISDGTQWLTI